MTSRPTVARALALATALSVAAACADGPTAPTVASLRLEPAADSVFVGEHLALHVTLLDAAGSVLTGRVVSWRSTDTAVAPVHERGASLTTPPDSAPAVTGVAPGVALIVATSEGVSDTTVVTVQGRVGSVSIDAPSTMYTRRTAYLHASARDRAGFELPSAKVTWTVEGSALCFVAALSSSCSAPGDLADVQIKSGGTPGTATVTAESEGMSAALAITVLPSPTLALTISVNGPWAGVTGRVALSLREGAERQLWIDAEDSLGYSVSGSTPGLTIVSAIEDSTIATVRDASTGPTLPRDVRVLGRRAGTTRVTFSCAPPLASACDSATATVTVALVPPDTVTAFGWLPDGRALVYAGSSPGAPQELWLRSGGGTDTFLGLLGPRPARRVVAAPDGSSFYAALEGPASTGPGSLVQVSRASGAVTTLADSVDPCGWFCAILEVSPDGRYVLFRRFPTGDVWAYDISLAHTAAVAAGVPRAFSPDGREVLVQGFTDSAWSRVALATGQRTALAGIPSGTVAAVWDAQGIHILRSTLSGSGTRFSIVEVATGTERVVGDSLPFAYATALTLAPDLGHVAYLRPLTLGGWRPGGDALHAFDVGGRQDWDLGANCSVTPYPTSPSSQYVVYVASPPAISPDGRAIACVTGGTLTVVGVP